LKRRTIKKLSDEAIKRITGGNEYKCTYVFNPKATKTCEEVLEKIFIKFLKENNIELID
jgi:hypothetical protein